MRIESCRFSAIPVVVLFAAGPALPDARGGLAYTNYVLEDIPWSIHAVLIDRADPSCR